MKYFVLGVMMLGVLACSTTPKAKTAASDNPTKIIFLIGDGMGLSAVSTGIYFAEGPSVFERFKTIGLSKTSSASHKITDSAASGTAMAAGTKTYNGAIGKDTLKSDVVNITEIVSPHGWKTGVVSTSSITHATPASFYSHVEQRGMEEAIAAQLLDSEIDFFAGGGIKFFNQREDGQDLISMADSKGFSIDTTGLAEASSLKAEENHPFGTNSINAFLNHSSLFGSRFCAPTRINRILETSH